MDAVWVRLRSDFRSRWRAWLSLTLLLGVFGGIVLTAAVGARRTDTAYPRFLEDSAAADVAIVGGELEANRELERLPQVAAGKMSARFFLNPVDASGRMDLGAGQPVATVDDLGASGVDRPKLLAGRLPHPDREDEALASRTFATRNHLDVGTRFTVRRFTSEADFEDFDPNRVEPSRGEPVTFTVTGIAVSPTDVVPTHEAEWAQGLTLTPAYFRAHAEESVALSEHIRLKPGVALSDFLAAKDDVATRHPELQEAAVEPHAPLHAQVKRAIQPQAVALALFALLAGIATFLIVGQTISRQLAIESTDAPTLRALGMTARQLFAVAMLRVTALSVVGAAVAVLVAVAGSPLMPIGPARLAEPRPGLAVNAGLLAFGFAAMVLLMLGRAALPAWRAAAVASQPLLGTAELTGAGQGSRMAETAARAGLPASASTGVRLALEPGHGRSAVPVRSTLVATVVAIASVTAAATFTANLKRLVDTPRLWGRGWDVTFDGHAAPVLREPGRAILDADPDVTAFSGGTVGLSAVIEGREVPALGFDPQSSRSGKEPVFPTLLEGRQPSDEGEIVLGTKVLRHIHRSVGDELDVRFGDTDRRMRVVGRAVFPAIGGFLTEATGLGNGVSVLPSVLNQGDPERAEEPYTFYAVRLRPGGSAEQLRQEVLAPGGPCPFPCYFRPARPPEISNYERILGTPLALAGVLGLLAVATLGHTLLTSISRRRRDLAILKTLGFARGQVSATVAWQATTLAAVAAVVGLPFGVAAGRWGWSLLADQLGVDTSAVTPALSVLLALPAAILVANLIAALPARAAARTQPALVLRTE
ncbi:MAG: ABC transporter permease [Actinomycetota bacterium]|nr:ABC transporter permease [Actinomycetota bacterium]